MIVLGDRCGWGDQGPDLGQRGPSHQAASGGELPFPVKRGRPGNMRGMRNTRLLCLVSVAGLGLTACGSSAPAKAATGPAKAAAGPSPCEQGTGISQSATTSSYKMMLDIGPEEKMYTRAEVQASHPRTGEVTLRGQMVMTGMTDPASAHHLEVHICARSDGQVVSNLSPGITVVDNSAGNRVEQVPTAVMQGVDSGRADLHYGNTVVMPSDHRFTVDVDAAGQIAVFHVATPAASKS